MPINNFYGKTFVAFADIAGFKEMMKDGDRGPLALDALYQSGYDLVSAQPEDGIRVEGFFISDCGVLFVRGDPNHTPNPQELFDVLLDAINSLNRKCFEKAVSLTTAIAWGDFSYHERLEVTGIEKNPIYGNAYVSAFIDNEVTSPKLYPNDCRILKHDLPPIVFESCTSRTGRHGARIRNADKHFYFEWMRQ